MCDCGGMTACGVVVHKDRKDTSVVSVSCSGRTAAATAGWAGGRTVNAGCILCLQSDSEFDVNVESEEQICSVSCFPALSAKQKAESRMNNFLTLFLGRPFFSDWHAATAV